MAPLELIAPPPPIGWCANRPFSARIVAELKLIARI